MNNNLESILSNYYYGPTDMWADFVGAVEKWAREERADAWDEGHAAGMDEGQGATIVETNPHRK